MINKKGKEPNLTWIFIGIAFAITAMTLSFTSYDTFLSDNNISVSDSFNSISGNITGEQDTLKLIKSEATESSNIYGVMSDAITGTLNVFVTGLKSIGAFFTMGTMASSILNISSKAIPGLDALFGLLIMVSGLYIIMRLITARRGVSNTA